jgi:two-component system chemotaxis sensor kinase CheA
MDDELLACFIEDCNEHLASIENELMDLEAAGSDFDQELVNSIFRTAHSIKGSAKFFSLENVSDLAHVLENILHMVREHQLEPTPDLVGQLLAGFDMLQSMVKDPHASHDMDIAPMVAGLQALFPSTERPRAEQIIPVELPKGAHLFDIDALTLDQAMTGGKHIYLVQYDLIHDVHQKKRTPLDIINAMLKSGYIIDCAIDIEAVGGLDQPARNDIPFYVLFATIIDPDVVRHLFLISDDKIHSVGPELQKLLDSGADLQAPPPPGGDAEPEWSEEVGGCTVCGMDGAVLIQPGESATLDEAGDLRAAMEQAVTRGTGVRLDLSRVQETDLSFLQLVVAFRRELESRGRVLAVSGFDGGPVGAQFDRFGLTAQVEGT